MARHRRAVAVAAGSLSLSLEVTHLRAAAWIVIAFLSGMRDEGVRELGRDCAFTELADHGRVRYKLRGRVYKGALLWGELSDWVVLEVVHQAVDVLLQLNDDPPTRWLTVAARSAATSCSAPYPCGWANSATTSTSCSAPPIACVSPTTSPDQTRTNPRPTRRPTRPAPRLGLERQGSRRRSRPASSGEAWPG